MASQTQWRIDPKAVDEGAAFIRSRFPTSGYVAYHAPRWAFVLKQVQMLTENAGTGRLRVLDIGRSALTNLLEETLSIDVDSMGFELVGAPRAGAKHYQFDLNDAQYEERWLVLDQRYDLIIFGEVIEHLHTAPQLVLSCLRSLMAPGAIMLLQTPNAVQLSSRLKMLAGHNPYHLINTDPTEPAHFREYTAQELRSICEDAGFTVEACDHHALFDWRYRAGSAGGHRVQPDRVGGGIRNLVYRHVPADLRPGLSLVLRA